MLRSIAAELSAQPLDHLLSLTVAGVDLLGETGQGVQVDALDEDIVRTAESSGANTAACLEEFDVALTTTARANGLPGEEFVVDVVVAGGDADSDLVNRLAETSLPGSRGTALVTTCPLGPEARRIILADGRAQIPHLGLTVDAANLGRSDLERMNRMLRNEPDGTPSPGDLRPPTAVVGDGSGDAIDRAPGPNRQWPTLTDVPDATSPQWRCCVRVFAGHLVEDSEGELLSFRYGENPDVPHKNTHRGPELISYLALSGREATRDRIRDDLWWDRSVRTETVQKTIHGTRKVLGGPDLLSRADGKPYRYRLADEVVTDVELLEHAVHQARSLADSPDGWSEMLDVLRPHFLRIEAPAFHDDAMGRGLAEWAAAHRIVDRVERPLVEAALLVAHHADDQPDRIPAALWAIDQALIACPTNEPLIRAAMNLEAEVGDRASAESRYHALATQLAKDDLDPEPETEALRRHITHDRPIG